MLWLMSWGAAAHCWCSGLDRHLCETFPLKWGLPGVTFWSSSNSSLNWKMPLSPVLISPGCVLPVVMWHPPTPQEVIDRSPSIPSAPQWWFGYNWTKSQFHSDIQRCFLMGMSSATGNITSGKPGQQIIPVKSFLLERLAVALKPHSVEAAPSKVRPL